jgi:integrase
MSKPNSTRPASPSKVKKPAKPYPDFPLTMHPTGQWCKKIRGKLHYFGKDSDEALDEYNRVKDDLHAGKTPRPDPDALTIKDITGLFLQAKEEAVAAGELAPRTYADYKSIMKMLTKGMGKHKVVATIDPQDFAALKNKLAKVNGPHRLCTVVQVIRSAFKYAYDSGLLDRPMRFGPAFKRTSKKTLRLHKAKQGAKLFTRQEILGMLLCAPVHLEVMILLGINGGMGNADCGLLSLSALNLDTGVIDFPRPKTGIPRKFKLWPETIEALREAIAQRPRPKNSADADLVFITKYGLPWFKSNSAGPLTQEVRKLMNRIGINGHRNFYTLRHTFRTVADESKDQPAVDYVMGHEVAHMSSVYRETISDARMQAVADHVRQWLFGKAVTAIV